MSEESESKEGETREAAPARQTGLAITLVIVAFGVSLLLAEILLRVAWRNPFVNETPDYLIKLERNHPFRDFELDGRALGEENSRVRFRTNERGYILPSDQFEEPQATIAFLGASTTANPAVSEELRFPALVSSLLSERGLRVNTLNAGKSGISSQDSINLLFNQVVFDEPDVAVMMHAHNDIGRLAGKGEYSPRRAGPASLATTLRWALQRGSINSSLIGALRYWQTIRPFSGTQESDSAETLLGESQQRASEKYVARLKSFIGICRAFGITPVLMTQPAMKVRTALTPDWTDPRNQEIFNHLIREVGAEEDVLVIDLVRFFFEGVENWNEPMVVFYDGVHFNNPGSRLAASYIADQLYEFVLEPRQTASE